MYSVAFIQGIALLLVNFLILGSPLLLGIFGSIFTESPEPLALAASVVKHLGFPVHIYIVAWFCANQWGPHPEPGLIPKARHWGESLFILAFELLAMVGAGLVGGFAGLTFSSAAIGWLLFIIVWLLIFAQILTLRRKWVTLQQKSQRKPRSKPKR